MCEAIREYCALTPEQEEHAGIFRASQCTVLVCTLLALLSVVLMGVGGNVDATISFYSGLITLAVALGTIVIAGSIFSLVLPEEQPGEPEIDLAEVSTDGEMVEDPDEGEAL